MVFFVSLEQINMIETSRQVLMHSPHRSSRLLGPGSNLKESDQSKGDVGGLGHKKEFKCRECPSLVFTSGEEFTEHLKVIIMRSLL